MSSVNRSFFGSLSLTLSTTLGAGIFALPYVFATAGWLLAIAYLCVMSVLVIGAHLLYLRVLRKVREKDRLLGLVRKHFGQWGYYTAFGAIVIGLLLTLLAYLILIGKFMSLAAPGLSPARGLWIFWLAVSILLLSGLRRLGKVELFGALVMAGIIAMVFLTTSNFSNLPAIPLYSFSAFFLPFSAILFSLAGWPAIEPAYELDGENQTDLTRGISWGTIIASMLYAMFALAIIGSVSVIAPDTISGLDGWPWWKLRILGFLGIFLILTSYLPIGVEIKNAIEKDLAAPRAIAWSAVIFIPPLLYLFGFDSFLRVVELVGGLFVSTQYLFIILVGRRVLTLNKKQKMFYDMIALVFLLAAVYETAVFVGPNFFG